MALTVTETLASVPSSSRPTVTHDVFNVSGSLISSSTPPVSKFAGFSKALVAGAGTIDLTALTGTNGSAVDGTGLKVQALRIQVPSTNVNPVVLQAGGSSGYNLFGASWKLQLNPGEEFLWIGKDKAAVPDIDATHKNIGLADGGAGGTESCNFEIVLG
jgi:GTPase involved in cell partitioning and DNA repair